MGCDTLLLAKKKKSSLGLLRKMQHARCVVTGGNWMCQFERRTSSLLKLAG